MARSPRPHLLERVVAALVVVGLVVTIAAGVFLIDHPTAGDLPSIAFGSEAILVVERIAMLFATWLLAVVVLIRALAGDLPIEISGRGLRYAEAETAQRGWAVSERSFERVDRELKTMREAIAGIEGKSNDDSTKTICCEDGDDGS